MPRLLAFDTSTEAMSIALQLPDRTLTFEGDGGAQASARLIPEVMALLVRGGCTLQDLDTIGFGRGPGAFTGLRTACSVAQGFALGAGKPVLPIDSLLIVAQDALEPTAEPLDCWVAMDARMAEIYAARYRWADGRWQTVVSPCLIDVPALSAVWHHEPPACVAGSALVAFADQLRCGAARQVPQPRSRAVALAQLAQAAWEAGEAVDAALALPIYVRDKVAQTTVERDAARAAKVVAA
jgi:tRNA threonylcarbamoyladenosine biosynthesis protein TsaB